MGFRKAAAPAARTEGLIVERLDTEALVYDTDRNRAHSLSPLAAAVFDLCDGSRDAGELATLASDRLGEPVGLEAVEMALGQLGERELLVGAREERDVGMLDESARAGGAVALADGLSRRDMLRRSAFAGAAAASMTLITTVVAPTPAAAQSPGAPSNVPLGGDCTADSQCAEGVCENGVCCLEDGEPCGKQTTGRGNGQGCCSGICDGKCIPSKNP